MATRVLTTLEELDAKADRWGPLDEAAVSPPQAFSWIRACAASFAEELAFVVVERDGQLAAVAPLVPKEGVLELVGARDLYEPADFAYCDEEALGSLAAELRRRKEQFARTLTERLLAYACGRRMEPMDRPEVNRIVKELAGRGYGYKDLIELVTISTTFQSK